ncbi:hypothetical protein GCM10023147_38520 [Tsukamurella soli]|uniref:Uncharacterized protein n=1 Tax=Tsukamurella soli TaxID=644556 RepID=A0ABP8K4F4_9ACTN
MWFWGAGGVTLTGGGHRDSSFRTDRLGGDGTATCSLASIRIVEDPYRTVKLCAVFCVTSRPGSGRLGLCVGMSRAVAPREEWGPMVPATRCGSGLLTASDVTVFTGIIRKVEKHFHYARHKWSDVGGCPHSTLLADPGCRAVAPERR